MAKVAGVLHISVQIIDINSEKEESVCVVAWEIEDNCDDEVELPADFGSDSYPHLDQWDYPRTNIREEEGVERVCFSIMEFVS